MADPRVQIHQHGPQQRPVIDGVEIVLGAYAVQRIGVGQEEASSTVLRARHK